VQKSFRRRKKMDHKLVFIIVVTTILSAFVTVDAFYPDHVRKPYSPYRFHNSSSAKSAFESFKQRKIANHIEAELVSKDIIALESTQSNVKFRFKSKLPNLW
jgi:hypothetical protein